MPRLVNRPPSYREHKGSGQGVVTLSGKDVYLGVYGTRESKKEYDRLIAEWLSSGRCLPASRSGRDLRIAELVLAYWNHAEGYHAADESPGELHSIKLALRVLRKLYGETEVASFGPLALKSVRSKMLERGWCRTYINAQVNRLRRVFKWGVEQEMVPASVLQAMQAVGGLKKGKSEAPEAPPVKPVSDEDVDAILSFVAPQVEAMIELQRITGMRPAEVCQMRGCDIDTTGKLWAYKPAKHKTEHHGHERMVYLGPKAKEVVQKFLKPDLQAYLFSPADAEAQRRAELQKLRKTPLSMGNKPGSNRKRSPGRKPGLRYTVAAYRRAIARGCEIAFNMPPEYRDPRTVEAIKKEKKRTPEEQKRRRLERRGLRSAWRDEHVWHPHQLRHTAATNLRREYGLEAAQVILGHKTLTVTQLYAEKNVEAARKIMAEVG